MSRTSRAGFLVALFITSVACSPVSRRALYKQLAGAESEFRDHIGFYVYDPGREKEVYSFNAAKYFTPASNTKIFTFYTGLIVLGDSVPGLAYRVKGDSLIFKGTGDPSFLYPAVCQNSTVYDFLQNARQDLYFSTRNFQSERFGPGWAWDDYRYSYSAERSPFPVYGNTFSVYKRLGETRLRTKLPFFKRFVWLADSVMDLPRMRRAETSMQTEYYPSPSTDSIGWQIPFRTDPLLVTEILSDTLHRRVRLVPDPVSPDHKIKSVPRDSLLRVMLQHSDNFIAEQLLLLCAGELYDTLDATMAINYMLTHYLDDLPDPPEWVDGSGLSRYNLVTPRDLVTLWIRIAQIIPRERLFAMLAAGDRKGTLYGWYKTGDVPYVFGKTGTLSNNHCLSGFLVTHTGKTFIFSFMNSNYTVPTATIKHQMEEILLRIYERY